MSKFTVMYKSTNSMYLNVEADSLEEAKETAENTDGGELDLLDMSDKELVECRSLLLERINWCMTAILES